MKFFKGSIKKVCTVLECPCTKLKIQLDTPYKEQGQLKDKEQSPANNFKAKHA